MKAMKQLLIVIGLMSALTLNAQTIIEYPVAQMYSTSAMVESGSVLPNAASSGVITADEWIGNDEPTGESGSGPRRARPGDWNDPYDDPLTDAVPCLLLLAIAYAFFTARKRRAVKNQKN